MQGDQEFNVGVLQSDGAFSFGRLAPGGTTGQVLTRTGTGKEWADQTGMGGGLTTVASDTTLSGDGTSGDPLGIADDSITTVQLANLAVHTANLGLLSVHAAQLADDEITEPKLAASNAPGTNQVLSWDGATLTWADQTGGGGTGDITAVGVGTGLSGGGTTGDVTIELDLIGLPVLTTVEANDRVMLLDVSDSNLPKEMAASTFASELTPLLRLDVLTLEAQIVATDNFVFSDSSNSNVIRRVTWGGAIARMADQDTLITANAVMRINSGGVDTGELAGEAVDESKMDISNAPTNGYVLGWNGTEMEWRAEGSTPTPTHTSYTATGDDQTWTEAEFLAGNSGVGNSLAVTDWTGAMYAAFARPVSAGTITELYWHAQGGGRGNNQIGGWTIAASTLSISGEDHYVIYSNNLQTFFMGLTFVIEVA